MKTLIFGVLSLLLVGCGGDYEEEIGTTEHATYFKKCKQKKCYQYKKVCTKVKNPFYNSRKCNTCNKWLKKKYCEKYFTKCCWKKVVVKCPDPKKDAGTDSNVDTETDSGLDAGVDSDPDNNVDGSTDTTPDTREDSESDSQPDLTTDSNKDSADDSEVLVPPAGSSTWSSSGNGSNTPENNEDNEQALAGGCSVTGKDGNTTMSFGLISLFLLFIVVRFRKLNNKSVTILAVLSVTLSSFAAYGIPTQTLRPATGNKDYVVTQDGKLTNTRVGLLFHHENRPLRLISKPGNNTTSDIIKHRDNLHIMLGTSFFNRLEVGADIPMVLGQNAGDLSLFNLPYLEGGVGDVRLLFKVRLYTRERLNLAFASDISLPTSTVNLTGERAGSLTPKLIASYGLGPVDFALNAGFRFRSSESFSSPGLQPQGVGQLFVGSLAAKVHLVQKGNVGLNFVSDLHTSTTLSNTTQEEVPLEWLNMIQANLPFGVAIQVGAGAGLTRGVGNPAYRVLAGISWNFNVPVCPACVRRTVVRKVPVYKVKKVKVVVRKTVLIIPPVFFAFDKEKVEKQSRATLDSVAETLLKNKWINTIILSGHTDVRGSNKYNNKLAQKRVNTVKRYLIKKGVSAKRLKTISFGEEKPFIKDAKTKEDHARNRRVEFK